MENIKFVFYVLFWLVLAQTLTVERMVVGILVCSIVFIFNKDLRSVAKNNNRFSISSIKYSLLYIGVLIKEIFMANFHVAKIVLSPKLNTSLSIVTIDTKVKSDINKTILANSITLTPGTLTLEMLEDQLVIHCLDEEAVKGLENNCFESILLKKEEINHD